MQFGSSIPFRDSYKGLEIQGKKSAGSKGTGLSEIHIEYGEFAITFSEAHPMIIHNENGSEKLTLSGYAKFPDRLEVRFSNKYILIISENENGNIVVLFETPEATPQVLEVPFFLKNPEELKLTEGFPVIQHPSKSSKEGYFVRMPAGSVIDNGAGCLRIQPRSDNTLIYIENSEAESIITYWFSKQPVSVSDDQYRRGVNKFLDKSYYGWKTARYNNLSASWKGNTGNVFSEKLINAYACQAFNEQEGYTFTTRIVPAITANHDLTYISNPIMGNIVNTSTSLHNDMEKTDQIISTGELVDISEIFTVLRFAPVIQPEQLEILKTRLIDIIANQTDASTLCLQTYLYFKLFELNENDQQVYRKIEEILLPKLSPFKDGYIFESLEDVSDTFYGILAGTILAAQTQNSLYANIGKSVILTYLSMADSTARIPRELLRNNSTWTEGTEYLLPEEIYDIVSPGEFAPKAFKLESNMWAWTIAKELSSVARGNQIHISSTFPIDGIYHITVNNVEPFSGIRLYGIPWKSDPQFQRYSSGWVYSLDTKTLFLKIKQRRPVETIVIDYSAPVPPEPTTENTPLNGISIVQ